MMVAKRASLRNTEARSGLALMNNPHEWINKDGVKATELEKLLLDNTFFFTIFKK